MTEKQKGLYARKIVALCLIFCAAVIVATYIARWWDVDTVPVMTCCCGLFGGELVLLMVKRLVAKDEPKSQPARSAPKGSESKPPGANGKTTGTGISDKEGISHG